MDILLYESVVDERWSLALNRRVDSACERLWEGFEWLRVLFFMNKTATIEAIHAVSLLS